MPLSDLAADRAAIALIGAGPRGTSILERIGARLRTGDEAANAFPDGLDIHVIDDAQSGAGRIWRTDQSRELCMNTLSHAVTLFTEESSTVRGPVEPGPTLYEWSILALHASRPDSGLERRVARIPAAHVAAFADHPLREGLADDYRAELGETVPETHPSRALYGEYLSWCYDRAVARLPQGVRAIRHCTRAVGIRRAGPRERVELADGGTVLADSVIAAAGWLERADTVSEREIGIALTARPDLVWVRPGSPVDQDLSLVPAGGHAIVRGLGMGFFDTMALLTVQRGGRFAPDGDAPGGLRYLPSGREPILHATSRRGVPFRSKTLYRSLPPRAPQRFLLDVDWAAEPRPIDFDRAMWPRIVADACLDHAETLHRVRPGALAAPFERVRDAISEALETVLGDGHDAPTAGLTGRAFLHGVARSIGDAVAAFVEDPADRFDVAAELDPAEGSFANPEQFDAWVRERVAEDLAAAELGRDSALKASLWSISSARAVANRVGTFGGFDAESRGSGFALLMAVGGMAGSGPPAFRNRQLLALAEAGLVRFIGPDASLGVEERGFVSASPRVAGSEVVAPVLIDAWMHFHDIGETSDPLVRSLLDAGRARPFRVARRGGAGTVATRGIDIDGATGLLVGEGGELDPSVHFAGIPVDDTLHETVISPMPGIDPPMLRETDRVARSALRIAAARTAHSPDPLPGAAYV